MMCEAKPHKTDAGIPVFREQLLRPVLLLGLQISRKIAIFISANLINREPK